MERIKIATHKIPENKNEAVRLKKDAQIVLRQLQRESGLSASKIASEIILKAADYVDFTEDGHVSLR